MTSLNFHTSLHQKTLHIVQQFKKYETELIKLLGEIDYYKTFRKFGYTSLFDYAVNALCLSESVSYNYITVARKCMTIPALKKEITSGAISVTHARKIAPVLTSDNQTQLLSLAKNLSARKLEKEIATLYPKAATPEQIKYTSEKRLALQCGVSEELMLKLKRIQDLESTRQRKNISLEEALAAMAITYLHHKDPLEKAKRQQARGKLLLKSVPKRNQVPYLNDSISSKHSNHLRQPHSKQTPNKKSIISNGLKKLPVSIQVQRSGGSVKRNSNKAASRTTASKIIPTRTPISAQIIHHVRLKDQGQCSFSDLNGKKCQNKRFLEIHHKKPVARGGSNTPENLTILCSAHHKILHMKT